MSVHILNLTIVQVVYLSQQAKLLGQIRLEITGTKGKLICENDTLKFFKNPAESTYLLKNSKEFFYKSECKVEEILLDGDNPQHRGIMNNFTNFLLGKEELFVDGKEGINGVELMNAVELSGWLDGKKIDIPVSEEMYLQILKEKWTKN